MAQRKTGTVASQPAGGLLCVGSFSTAVTDQSVSRRGEEQTLQFNFLFSDDEVLRVVSEDNPALTWADEVGRELILAAFGANRYALGTIRLELDKVVHDPREFPARLHRIFTRDNYEGSECYCVDSLYGYKAVKWSRADVVVPPDPEEAESGDDQSSEDDEEEAYSEGSQSASESEAEAEETGAPSTDTKKRGRSSHRARKRSKQQQLSRAIAFNPPLSI